MALGRCVDSVLGVQCRRASQVGRIQVPEIDHHLEVLKIKDITICMYVCHLNIYDNCVYVQDTVEHILQSYLMYV